MLQDILPDRIARALNCLDFKGIREIRIRVGLPIVVNFGSLFYLGENGIVGDKEYALSCSFQEMQDIVFKACECSVYAHNEELKMGFVTLPEGQRIGVCGELVVDKNNIKTLKNFSSINIRIPHPIPNCSLKVLPYLYDENGLYNTLIISPPGAGKTTFLRDLCYQISSKYIVNNILIIDERGEIANCKNGKAQMSVGNFADIYSFCPKEIGLENGIRTLAPDVIIMDELSTEKDILSLNYAIGSGVKIVATAHAGNMNEFLQRPYFKTLITNKIFKRIIVLSNRDGVGTIEGVYNENQIFIN